MPIAKADDLYLDEVRWVVDWDAMEFGMSVFVPTLNTRNITAQARTIAERRGIKVKAQSCIEPPYFGVRIWRTA